MSIIYDALQKVQKNITQEKSPLQPETLKNSPPAKGKTRPIFIYVLVVFFGLTLGNFAYNFLNHRLKKIVPTPSRTSTAIKQTAVTINPKIEEPTNPSPLTSEPTLVLNGVFFEQGEGYALINNKIVRLGDEIEHAKVKEITIDGVMLDLDGKTIKLTSSPSS